MVNIALIGYGKMGQVIEKIVKEKGHEIKVIIDPNCEDGENEINEATLKDVDVCIDFTHPDCAVDNIRKMAALKKNIVVGTTGWYDQMKEVEQIVKDHDIGLIWSGNFSIGVNAFFRMIEGAAKTMNKLSDYDVFVHEFHHNQKADSPSGTAVMIGNILTDNIDRKDMVVTEELKRKIEPNELHVSSTRGGSVPGTHIVGFDSKADTIELTHTARGREGFATGAVMAAEFLNGKKGFFSINDMMDEVIGGG